jgi:Transmembrane domain of unknown function (DUF3566)
VIRAESGPARPDPEPDASSPTFAVAPTPTVSRAAAQSFGRVRRTRAEIRHIGPWSVLKFSLLFYLCVMLIVWVALVIIYGVLSAAGAIDALARILGGLFPTTPTVSTKGAPPMKIDSIALFTYLLFACCGLAVVWSLINLVLAYVYNLISDVIGGIEVTLADRNK